MRFALANQNLFVCCLQIKEQQHDLHTLSSFAFPVCVPTLWYVYIIDLFFFFCNTKIALYSNIQNVKLEFLKTSFCDNFPKYQREIMK